MIRYVLYSLMTEINYLGFTCETLLERSFFNNVLILILGETTIPNYILTSSVY